ncbi:uncharacterized protein LOC116978047 isoform X2 [Amblyraja radiata]|uniref:uncharacterized protein LOC116978047 isoform X2 n=1 Tax=Amblyraja radiata TaxID=386614 RepID=UPI0014041449|nr:uncharacterized protein LOC116978047 isoform X2 [Amblyraja radiata]
MKMSGNISRKNFISRIVFVSLISTVYTPGNAQPDRNQNYACRDSENQTIALNVTLKTCYPADMTINGTVVANEEGCQPPIINVIFGISAVITGCHIILYRCFYNGTEEWLILTPIPTESNDTAIPTERNDPAIPTESNDTAIRTERNDPGLPTEAIVAICFGIVFLMIIIIIIVRWRFSAHYLKKFLPVSAPQTRILWKKNSRGKNPTDDTANDQSTQSEAEAVKLVPSGDGERQETLESSKDDNITVIE